MKQKVYLVYVLIEYSAESITDAHYVYSSLEKAREKMQFEIDEARENFNIEGGSFGIDTDNCQDWSNDCGQGYTVGVE
ncbi:MAG: hypothetical protein NC548_46700, partial [Lachnospiraceae bacterium]|nr:hypothetical protein [Lachnospiraceae bacterium]